MMNKIIMKLYNVLPYTFHKKIGSSKILRPLRNAFLRNQGSYVETKVQIKRNYLEYPISFFLFTSLKMGAKAVKSGLENTILQNSIKLLNKRVSNDNAVILDVGANFGYLTLVWANSVSQKGKVISFEPNPKVHASLLKSVKANKLESKIELNNLAVGKNDGSIELYVDSTTSNTLKPTKKIGSSHTIDMVSLNSYINKNNIEHCDLVKIDVDGIEFEILMGSTELIKKCAPIFIVETNNDKRIIDFFRKQNYQILDMKLNPFQSSEQLPPNIFCLPIKE